MNKLWNLILGGLGACRAYTSITGYFLFSLQNKNL